MFSKLISWFSRKSTNPTLLIEIFKDKTSGDEFIKLKIDWAKETPERLKDVFSKLFVGLKTASFQQNMYIALQDKAFEAGLPKLPQEIFEEMSKIEGMLPKQKDQEPTGQLIYPSEVFSPYQGEN